MIRLFLVILLALTFTQAQADPFSDLASPLPQVRDQAAKTIRDEHLYRSTPREPWDRAIAGIDLTQPHVWEIIGDRMRARESNIAEWDVVDTPNGMIVFPLDRCWSLVGAMERGRLVGLKVVYSPRVISVNPPYGYSGFWRIYREDGTLAHIYDYQNGMNLGDTLKMQ